MKISKILLLSSALVLSAPINAFSDSDTSREGTSSQNASGADVLRTVGSGLMNSSSSDLPEWAKRIEFEGSFDDKPAWSILTTQPIYQSEDKSDTFFTQLSVLKYTDFGEERTTTNAGLGYRKLTLDKSLILGANSFYDHDWEFDHQRTGVGLEARSMPIELNANYYKANSGIKTITSTLTERAIDGWDSEIGVQLPYLPWAKVFSQVYSWNGETGRDLQGSRFSLRMQPSSWLEFEAGRDENNQYEHNAFAKVSFKLRFNEESTEKTKFVDDKPFAFGESMEGKLLEKVRRTNKIVVERNSSVGGSLTFTVSRGS